MDSGLYGVPSPGIRAPLTMDDSDSENSLQSSSYLSGSELDSDVFVSGDDDFVKQEEFDVSKPAINPSGEEIGQLSTNASVNTFSRLRIDTSVKNVDFGEDGKYLLPVVDPKSPIVQNIQTPIAQISVDSDNDSEVLEEGFSGIVRIPSLEVLSRLNSTPRARPSDLNEGDSVQFVEEWVASSSLLGSVDEKRSFNGGFNDDKAPDLNEGPVRINEEIGEIEVTDDDVKDAVLGVGLGEEPEYFPGTGKVMESKVSELESSGYLGVVSFDDGMSKSSDMHLEDSIVVDMDAADDKMESGNPEENDEENLMTMAFVTDHSLESPDGFLKDAHLSTTEGNLDQKGEHPIVDEENEQFEAVEHPILGSESDATMADIVREQNPTISHGEASLNQPKETTDQIVMDCDEGLGADGGVVSSAYCETNADAVTSVDSVEISNSAHPSSTRPILEALNEAEKKQLEKIQQIKAKYLQILCQLGCSPDDPVPSGVLHQLKSAELLAFDLGPSDKASMDLVGEKPDAVCILVIGKSGVGKSSTINSIFGEKKAETNAFAPATDQVSKIIGTVDGVELKVFDTPGLKTSITDQSINRKILSLVKRAMQKSPPDVIIYVDRLDMQTNEGNDFHVLRQITSTLGSSIWRKSIIALTHGTTLPPDGPNGLPLSYEAFVRKKSWSVQQVLSRIYHGITVPVSLVENHPTVVKNGHSEVLLPHIGQNWTKRLILSCYTIKILSDFNSVVAGPNPIQSPLLQRVHPHQEDCFQFEDQNCPSLLKEASSELLRESDGSDHCCGRNGMVVEDVVRHFPSVTSAQLTKDQTMLLHSDILNVVLGLKLENHVALGEHLLLVGNAGFVPSEDDAACSAAAVELCRKDRDEISVGLSVVRQRNDVICGCNLQSQKLNVSVGLNRRLYGKICVKIGCTDQILIGAIRMLKKVFS